jgi:hypothetical protein
MSLRAQRGNLVAIQSGFAGGLHGYEIATSFRSSASATPRNDIFNKKGMPDGHPFFIKYVLRQ